MTTPGEGNAGSKVILKRRYYRWLGTMVGALYFLAGISLLGLPVMAATGTTIEISATADAEVGSENAVYATAHDSASGSYIIVIGGRAGQWPIGVYNVSRFVIRFEETANLPDDAIIQSVVLKLRIDTPDINAPWDLVVVDGSVVSNPIVQSDFGLLLPQKVSGGSIPADGGWGTEWISIPLNETGESWINVEGPTQLAIRSNKDISKTIPAGDDSIYIYGVNDFATPAPAVLVVNYSQPIGNQFVRVVFPVVMASFAILAIIGAWKGSPVLMINGVVWGLIGYIVAMVLVDSI